MPATMHRMLCAALVALGPGPSGAGESVLFETATVVARPIVEATASVTVLERQDIEALAVESVAELIRFLPGVDLVRGGPRGGLAVAQIRGGDPNFTVVLIDGVPLNDSTDLLRGGAVNLNSLPAALVERVEVVRGPLSSFFGSAALGGVINVITRRAPAPGRATSVDLGAGDASTRQAAASWSAGSGRGAGFVGAAWGKQERLVADDSFEQIDLRGHWSGDVGRHSKLRVHGRIADWEADDYPDLSGGPTYGSGQTRRAEHGEGLAGAEWRGGNPDRPQRAFVSAFRHDLQRGTPATPPFAPPIVEDTRYTRWRAGWSAPVLVGRGLQLGAGVELDRESGRNDSALEVAPGFFVPGSYRIHRTTGGAFVGLLAERGSALVEASARVDVPEGFRTEFSPRLAASFKLRDGSTRLRLSGGRGFKLPSFFVLASPAALGGNPNLRPERVLGFDAGVERRFGESGLSAALNVFHSAYEDLIDYEIQPDNSVISKNLNEVRALGAELALTWTGDRCSAHGALTRQDVENRQTGQELRNRPEWVAGAWITWQVTEHLRWSVDAQGASRSLDYVSPYTGGNSTAGYQVYGSSLRYELRQGVAVSLRADNLTDKEYETFIGFPGPGRSVALGLHWSDR